MKVEVTHVDIVDEGEVIAKIELVDVNVVKVDIRQVIGWNDWMNLTDAVRRAMLMMGVNNDA